MKTEVWNIEDMCGYKPKTTFWNDFFIAEQFGEDAIKETFDRSFNEWKHDRVYLTELAMVMNHKVWRYHGVNEAYSQLYTRLWERVDCYACENLNDDDLAYYLRTTN